MLMMYRGHSCPTMQSYKKLCKTETFAIDIAFLKVKNISRQWYISQNDWLVTLKQMRKSKFFDLHRYWQIRFLPTLCGGQEYDGLGWYWYITRTTAQNYNRQSPNFCENVQKRKKKFIEESWKFKERPARLWEPRSARGDAEAGVVWKAARGGKAVGCPIFCRVSLPEKSWLIKRKKNLWKKRFKKG